jgi:uncharacterized protein (TIGR03435 family)
MIVSESAALHFPSHDTHFGAKLQAYPGERMKLITLLVGMVVIAVAVMDAAQAPAQKPKFEVASIKRNLSLQRGGGGGRRGDRFAFRNATVTALVQYAFRPIDGQLFSQQIIGGPEWTHTDHFDIQAKMGGSIRSVTHERVQAMVQSLLEDRFQLKWHRETRDLPVYDLAVAKGGVKMRQSADQTPIHSDKADVFFNSFAGISAPLPRGAIRLARGSDRSALHANAVPVAALVTILQGQADRIVFDKTGLTALFDFDIEYNNEATAALGDDGRPPAAQPAPSLFTSIGELGLRLEPSKELLPVIVIDSVQRPTEN